MRHPHLGTGISLAVLACTTPALAEVAAVTLSSGGLAEITTRHPVSGEGSVRMVVPADQLDDILKSLVVRDPRGTVGGLRMAGPTQAEEILRGLPFKADDIASPARLAHALQGTAIPGRVGWEDGRRRLARRVRT